MDRAVAELLVKSIWFSGHQYEQAETRSQEYIARAHNDLKVEGKSIAPPTLPSSSGVESIIGQARSMIAETLRSATPKKPVSGGEDRSRVSQLEKENEELKKRITELEGFIKSKGLDPPGSGGTSGGAKEQNESDDDDDFDPFASEDEEEKARIEKIKEERLAAYHLKKSKKPALIAKSSIVLDVKPWDDETDMVELEKQVRNISADGLDWKGSQLVEIAYGIKKLQIICVVEDDKVGTDFLEEEICGLEDLVQSIDIVAFNKL